MTINLQADAAAEAARAATPERLENLKAMARELHKRQSEILKTEEELKKLKAAERELREKTLPEAMLAAEVKKLELANGVTLERAPFLTASLAGDVMARAIKWLQQSGHTGLIKREFVVSFGRGVRDEAEKLAFQLRKMGYAYEDKETVNTTSFKALVRELSEQGKLDTVPVNDVGVYMGHQAVLKFPKSTP